MRVSRGLTGRPRCQREGLIPEAQRSAVREQLTGRSSWPRCRPSVPDGAANLPLPVPQSADRGGSERIAIRPGRIGIDVNVFVAPENAVQTKKVIPKVGKVAEQRILVRVSCLVLLCQGLIDPDAVAAGAAEI
jgi:hypothetical protein